MVKKLLPFLLLCGGFAQAATLNIGTGFGTNVGFVVLDTTGAQTAYTIHAGTFTAEPTITDAASLKAALTDFKLWASGAAPKAAGAPIADSITSTFDPTTFNSASLYLVVTKESTLGAATQASIFKFTPNATFPSNVAAAGGTPYTVGNVSQIQPLGGAGVELAVDSAVGRDTIQLALAVVPEPTSFTLAGVAAFGLLLRRKRD